MPFIFLSLPSCATSSSSLKSASLRPSVCRGRRRCRRTRRRGGDGSNSRQGTKAGRLPLSPLASSVVTSALVYGDGPSLERQISAHPLEPPSPSPSPARSPPSSDRLSYLARYLGSFLGVLSSPILSPWIFPSLSENHSTASPLSFQLVVCRRQIERTSWGGRPPARPPKDSEWAVAGRGRGGGRCGGGRRGAKYRAKCRIFLSS